MFWLAGATKQTMDESDCPPGKYVRTAPGSNPPRRTNGFGSIPIGGYGKRGSLRVAGCLAKRFAHRVPSAYIGIGTDSTAALRAGIRKSLRGDTVREVREAIVTLNCSKTGKLMSSR